MWNATHEEKIQNKQFQSLKQKLKKKNLSNQTKKNWTGKDKNRLRVLAQTENYKFYLE